MKTKYETHAIFFLSQNVVSKSVHEPSLGIKLNIFVIESRYLHRIAFAPVLSSVNNYK